MPIDNSLPWLGFPPAVDLANTIVMAARGPVDLLSTDEELETWIAAEHGRIRDVESARGRVGEVVELRDAVHAVLHARAAGRTLPAAAVARLNAWSREVPVAAVLDDTGAVDHEAVAAGPFSAFKAEVARSAIDLAGHEGGSGLRICEAPSCGMLFLPSRARQTWCSSTCGNRARVARHARRVRVGDPPPRR